MPVTPPGPPDEAAHKSPNFDFLAARHPFLARHAALAERYLFDDPPTALVKIRQFAELLARLAAAEVGLDAGPQDEFAAVLRRLRDQRVAAPDVLDLFHGVRRAGNAAAHEGTGTRADALHHLRMAGQLAVWFHRAFGRDPAFQPRPFLPPPDPAAATAELHAELDRLRGLIVEHRQQAEDAVRRVARSEQTAVAEADGRRAAEGQAAAAYADLTAALALAEESEARLTAERAGFEEQLAAVRAAAAAQPAEAVEAVVAQAQRAATLLDLDEVATRRIIDGQLRDAGWEADSERLRYSKGVRPQKGRNLAVAEWPTAGGPADYVLFVGLAPIAAVEAKRAAVDVPAAVEQAKRYARDFPPHADLPPGAPWGEYKLPFQFATNGRPFLRQLQTKSGVWFLDARLPTNHPRPLEGWYTPAGLDALLAQDAAAADRRLRDEPPDFLPLRDYQLAAVAAVERGLASGLRELLVAMATGTGKTRTCIGLVYRLVRAKRFRRVLFLVDRTALGEQTENAFRDMKLESLQSFTDIYDVKGLGDLAPDPDTRLHVATVQGMVKRLLFPSADAPPPPVDAYDCVVVDECHRGYALDAELSEAELAFRDEADYVSKYRRVLDHFDAVKIGLTATPALHTVEIFGRPVYTYAYRQAVIDGWLVDHEPPVRVVTKLAEDGITWAPGEVIQSYLPATGEIDPVTAPDDVRVEIDQFNKKVVTENFNRVVCAELALHIDPGLPGKTIVFCATDDHADLVVGLLKAAFAAQYGEVEDDTVAKVTAAADKPLQLIRRFKNERLPAVAVTVDLLTTGIDVPAVANVVFLRRVRSRILYEQMLGRATRLCSDLYGPGEHKEAFRVFDAVDLYAALEPYSAMKPVVVRPEVGFAQLATELTAAPTAEARREVRDQFVAKLQRKRRVLVGANAEQFAALAGEEPEAFVGRARGWTADEARDWLAARPKVAEFLDGVRGLDPRRVLISEHADELRRVERGYGAATRPEDYLESFRAFVAAHLDDIPALLVVTRRPRDLTRQQLKDLKLALDAAGFTEAGLRTAWREATNQDIAATIIGYVRHVASGEPLRPYNERVRTAVQAILASRAWTAPQRKWLDRIGKQLEVETVVDREAVDHGQFKAEGGFARLNKVFDGKLEDILRDLTGAVWQSAA